MSASSAAGEIRHALNGLRESITQACIKHGVNRQVSKITEQSLHVIVNMGST
jgi:hypothetical protein